MAHFILEYSANLGPKVDVSSLLEAIVDEAVATGVFPRAGCRARAHRCDDYFIADGRAEFAFVHLQVRMGAGRSDGEKASTQKALIDVLKAGLQSVMASQGVAVSLELLELPPHKANLNNIREYLNAE